MRNGNVLKMLVLRRIHRFLSYLWGMETTNCQLEYILFNIFLSYLWGMETFYSSGLFGRIWHFLSYLWGMETPLWRNISFHSIDTFYPTYEEWKPVSRTKSTPKSTTFYPTYEEWKHFLSHSIIFSLYPFLSYLWGMETKNTRYGRRVARVAFYPTYEEWKLV